MPNLVPFTDTHVHFWDLRHPSLRYDWLMPDAVDARFGDIAAIKSQRYLPADFAAEARFQDVRRVVHVQAALGSRDPVEETRWLQQLADECGMPHGIVAYVDLRSEDAGDILNRHSRYANLRGVRDLSEGRYFENEAWCGGYSLLERYQLVYCDSTPPENMAAAANLARRYPNTIYCLDHVGYPTQRDRRYFSEWSAGIRNLSSVENTIVKISALGTYDRRWTVESLRPWILECINAWGVNRVLFGTNWPLDRLFSSYGDLLNAYRTVIQDFEASEQVALLYGNADRVFRLDQDVRRHRPR